MNLFDKICAILTVPIGAAFIVIGAIGFFMGSSAHFTLPPIVGVLPFFLGWSMFVTLIRFWRATEIHESAQPAELRSAVFMRFLEEHPEFRERTMKLQWKGFLGWLDRRGLNGDG